MLIRKISLALIFFFLFTFNSYSQVQQIWQPPSGNVSLITDPFGVFKFYTSYDYQNHVTGFYDLENYSLLYSIPDTLINPMYVLPDMNGNGYPEILGYMQGVRIIDLKTQEIIYNWGGSSGCSCPFTTPSSNVLKCTVTYRVGDGFSSSLYSLGIVVPNAVRNDNNSIPKAITLKQNYPNPFNPSTRIEYDLPSLTNVTIAIYNSAGQLIREFREGEKSQGHYSVVWDGKDERGGGVASGAYFYQVKAGNIFQTKKMMLLK
jgi:hypothetical protein